MGTPCGTWLKPGRSIAECLKLSGKTRHLRSVRLEKCGEHLSQTAEGWMWLLDAIPSMTKKRKREEGKKRVGGRGGEGREGRAELTVLHTHVTPVLQRLRHEEQKRAASQVYIGRSYLFSPPQIKMAA